MVRMRALEERDAMRIALWPPYQGDMEQMDYALREKGWLGELREKPGTSCYAFEEGSELVAFTLLAQTEGGDAEFRIALRADRTGLGLGKEITLLTLEKGFKELGLERIHLIVRKNNLRGIKLYRRIGFMERGECRKEIHGLAVEFRLMDIHREDLSAVRLQG